MDDKILKCHSHSIHKEYSMSLLFVGQSMYPNYGPKTKTRNTERSFVQQ